MQNLNSRIEKWPPLTTRVFYQRKPPREHRIQKRVRPETIRKSGSKGGEHGPTNIELKDVR